MTVRPNIDSNGGDDVLLESENRVPQYLGNNLQRDIRKALSDATTPFPLSAELRRN